MEQIGSRSKGETVSASSTLNDRFRSTQAIASSLLLQWVAEILPVCGRPRAMPPLLKQTCLPISSSRERVADQVRHINSIPSARMVGAAMHHERIRNARIVFPATKIDNGYISSNPRNHRETDHRYEM